MRNTKEETFGGFTLQAHRTTTPHYLSICRSISTYWLSEMPSAHPCPRPQGRQGCRVISRESWDVRPQSDIIPLPVWSCNFNFLFMPVLSQVIPRPRQEPTVEAGVEIRHDELGSRDIHTMTLDCWTCLGLSFLI